MNKIYIYLARRNKNGVKLLAIVETDQYCPPIRITNVKNLNLSKNLEIKIEDAIYQDRMEWEPWIESSKSFTDLKKILSMRGYKNIPIHSNPSITESKDSIVSKKDYQKEKMNKINMKFNKTMMRKK